MKLGITILPFCSKLMAVKLSCVTILSLFTLGGFAQRTCGFHGQQYEFLSSSARSTSEGVLYIPMVFHIVSSSPEQITDEQVYSQLDVINEDFSRQNADTIYTLEVFRALAADARIQFYIADNNHSVGITRTQTTHGPFHNDDLHQSNKGGADAWDTEKYLNVWVADLAGGLAGYASGPGEPAFRDGVAIHYAYFGRHSNAIAPYHLGRTLTHEIGHWLGLSHPWGTGGCESDDGVFDTPRQEGPVGECSLNHVSCGELSMTQNFMNTGVDECLNFFTQGQVLSMRETLKSLRPDVYSDAPLITSAESKPGKVYASFYPNPISQPIAFLRVHEQSFEPFTLSLTDLRGRNVRHYQLQKYSNDIPIDLEGLTNGVYVARIENHRTSYTTRIYLNLN